MNIINRDLTKEKDGVWGPAEPQDAVRITEER